jgi:DNA-binding GntR family transcriptional regulator
MFKEVTSQEQAYQSLKERILRLELAPGERVGALEVSVQLGLSRTPVREALGRLEQEALVIHDPAGGYVVRPMSIKEIDDLYRVREYLETEAVLEAMPNLGDTEFARLAALLDKAEAHIDEVSEFLITSRRFYEEIIAATGNGVLQRVLAPINDRVRIVGAMLIEAHALRMKEVCAENREILRALRSKDENAAVAAVHMHVRNARQHVATTLAQDQSNVFVRALAVSP